MMVVSLLVFGCEQIYSKLVQFKSEIILLKRFTETKHYNHVKVSRIHIHMLLLISFIMFDILLKKKHFLKWCGQKIVDRTKGQRKTY